MMRLLTIAQLAEMSGKPKSRNWIYQKVKSGEIPAIKVGRTYKVPELEWNKWIYSKLGKKLEPEWYKQITEGLSEE